MSHIFVKYDSQRIESRLAWYERSVQLSTAQIHINGFDYPEGSPDEWKGAATHCAIAYILEKGYETIDKISDEEIEKMETALENEQEEARKNGHMSLMTASFQASIVRCAKEIVSTVNCNELIDWIATSKKG